MFEQYHQEPVEFNSIEDYRAHLLPDDLIDASPDMLNGDYPTLPTPSLTSGAARRRSKRERRSRLENAACTGSERWLVVHAKYLAAAHSPPGSSSSSR